MVVDTTDKSTGWLEGAVCVCEGGGGGGGGGEGRVKLTFSYVHVLCLKLFPVYVMYMHVL